MGDKKQDNNTGKMSIFGVGPLFVVLSLAYGFVTLAATYNWPEVFCLWFVPRWLTIGLGALLLALGLPFFVLSLVILNREFEQGKLMCRGAYRFCRHPVYGSWVVFNAPGFVLLANSWLGLSVPFLMYATLRLLVRKEEKWCEETFGDAYRAYRESTPAVFPALWRWD